MKKITSILCALALVLSVSAAPQLKSIKNAASADKTMLEKNIVLKAETMKSFDFAKMAKAAKAPAARKAVATETDVNIVGYYATTYYGYLIFALVGDDGTEFYFSFDPDVIPTIEDDVTYTMDDMFAYFCYWYNGDLGARVDFSEVTFVKHTDANGKIQVEATATDVNGDVWNIDFDENDLPDPPAGGDFVADEIKTATTTGLIQYQLFVDDPELTLYVCINLGDGESDVESGKEYTLADMNASYTSLYFGVGTEIEIVAISFTKTVAADKSYTIAIVLLDADNNFWNITAAKAAPTTITISENKGLVFADKVASAGWWQVFGSNDDYAFSLSNNDNDQVAGVYDMADMDATYTYVKDLATNTKITFVSGSVTVVDNADGTYDFDGVFVDAEGNTYVFDLFYADPTEENQLEVTIADAEFTATTFSSYYYSYPGYVITGIDANGVEVELQLVADALDGDFTADDLWTSEGCLVVEGKSVIAYAAEIHIESDATTRTLTADILGYDCTLYKVTMTGEIPEPQDFEFSFSGTEVYFDDNIESSGWWYFSGENDDVQVDFSNSGSIDHIVGTYTEAELDGEYSFVLDKATGTQVGFSTAVVEITEQSNGSLHLYAECVGKDGNNYIITMQYGDAPTAIENTKAEVKAVKVLRNGQLVIIKNGVEYNAVGAQVK